MKRAGRLADLIARSKWTKPITGAAPREHADAALKRLQWSAWFNAKDRFGHSSLPMLKPTRCADSSRNMCSRSPLSLPDTFRSYNGLDARGYIHERINHSEGVYVVGEVHTNTIEGFWSLIKRGIGGVYHNVGRHYLQTYLNEYSFRYNRRFDVQPMFVSFLQQVEKRDAVVRQTEHVSEPF